jgi:hypothetical protein
LKFERKKRKFTGREGRFSDRDELNLVFNLQLRFQSGHSPSVVALNDVTISIIGWGKVASR